MSVTVSTTALADVVDYLTRAAGEATAQAARYEAMGEEFWPLAMHQRGTAAAYADAARMLEPHATAAHHGN